MLYAVQNVSRSASVVSWAKSKNGQQYPTKNGVYISYINLYHIYNPIVTIVTISIIFMGL